MQALVSDVNGKSIFRSFSAALVEVYYVFFAAFPRQTSASLLYVKLTLVKCKTRFSAKMKFDSVLKIMVVFISFISVIFG